MTTSPLLVTRLHLPHAILVRLHVRKNNIVILTPETAVTAGVSSSLSWSVGFSRYGWRCGCLGIALRAQLLKESPCLLHLLGEKVILAASDGSDVTRTLSRRCFPNTENGGDSAKPLLVGRIYHLTRMMSTAHLRGLTAMYTLCKCSPHWELRLERSGIRFSGLSLH